MNYGKDVPVTLGHWQFHAAVGAANNRMALSNESGLNNASTYQRGYMRRLHQETIGACGEFAVAKLYGKSWRPSVNTFHIEPDVGSAIEVRATARETGRLIVRDNDADDRWFILVTGKPPNLIVRGRIKGINAKKDKWVRNPNAHRSAWFVPQSALEPIPLPAQLEETA